MAGADNPSDRELFDDAVGGLDGTDDGADDRSNQRQPQPRDPPTGRFAQREDDDGGDDEPTDQVDDAQDDEPRGRVPSHRQRQEAQRRRDAEDREQRSLRMFDQLAERFGTLENELRTLRAPRGDQQQRQRPDVWRDPDEFQRDIDERFATLEELADSKARDKMINLTFRREHRGRGQEFEQAYRALQGMSRRGDRLADEITSDADPGAALMEWYDGERMRTEIGGDPDGYVERRTNERLKSDPKFRRQMAQALGFELLDDDGGRDEPPARNGRSGTQTLVRLPSVNRASGGGGGGNRRQDPRQPVTDGDFFADAVAGLPIARSKASARGAR